MQQGVATILEDYDGRFLLHLRDEKAPTMKSEWCLVGGRVDQDETIEDAIRREVKEETDLLISSVQKVTTFMRNDKLITIFHASIDTRNNAPLLHEGKKLQHFTRDELSMLFATLPYTNQYLDTLKYYLVTH